MTLTSQQLTSVQSRRLNPKPQYFNAALNRTQAISSQFEEFLILTPSDLKNNISTFILSIQQFFNADPDLKSLLLEAIVEDQADLANIKNELGSINSDYSDLKRDIVNTNYVSSQGLPTEVSSMFRNIELVIADNALSASQNDYYSNLLNILLSDFNSTIGEGNIRELLSLIYPISAYG